MFGAVHTAFGQNSFKKKQGRKGGGRKSGKKGDQAPKRGAGSE